MSIKSILKKIIPHTIITKFKMGVEFWHYYFLMKELESGVQQADYMLGTPIHTNLGDHLITLAQREFLDKNGYSRKIIEIPTEMFQLYKKRIKKTVTNDTRIYINGGGWMGNVWPNEELLLQEMVECFTDNKIIIFPQTIYYDRNTSPFDELIASGNNIFSKCKDFTLCVRDRQSYEFAKQKYPTIKVYLLPDISLAYYDKCPKNRGAKKRVVGYCLRNDRELYRDKIIENSIKEILFKNGFIKKEISTMSLLRVPSRLRDKVVLQRLKVFSECSLIVTDRLHGMIFSFLTGTPCIVFDNKTLKVSGVYNEWLKSYDYIFPGFLDIDKPQLEEFIETQINVLHNEKNFFEKEFKSLQEEIVNG